MRILRIVEVWEERAGKVRLSHDVLHFIPHFQGKFKYTLDHAGVRFSVWVFESTGNSQIEQGGVVRPVAVLEKSAPHFAESLIAIFFDPQTGCPHPRYVEVARREMQPDKEVPCVV